MNYFARFIQFHKMRIKESWNHKGNLDKKLYSLFNGYKWLLQSKIFKKSKDITVFGNMKFRCFPGTAHAASFFFNGTEFDNWNIMHFITEVLRESDKFIDIGANVGLFTLLAASKIGVGGKIIAIEPISKNMEKLKENIELNNLKNVTCLQTCLSDKIEEVLFEIKDVGSYMTHTVAENTEKIKSSRLDNIIQNETEEFIITKIDVEGMELLVLKGAEKSIRKNLLPIIIFEVNGLNKRFNITEEDIIKFMKEHDYILGYYNHDAKVLNLDNLLHEDTIAIKKNYIKKINLRNKDLKIINK